MPGVLDLPLPPWLWASYFTHKRKGERRKGSKIPRSPVFQVFIPQHAQPCLHCRSNLGYTFEAGELERILCLGCQNLPGRILGAWKSAQVISLGSQDRTGGWEGKELLS